MKRRLLALLFLGACDLARSPALPECRSDPECGSEAVCALGACVRVAESSLLLDLAFTPPNDSGYLKQQVAAVRVAAPGNSVPDQVLRPQVLFTGRVLVEGSGESTGIPARVEAYRAGAIAGTHERLSAVAVVDPLSGDRTFRLGVSPGWYEMRVYPEDASLPPTGFPSPLDLTTSLEKDLVLPARSVYRRVTGRVVRSSTDRRGVANVSVQGFDSSGRAVSTLGTSGTDGRFYLVFPPGDGTYAFRVFRRPEGPAIPTVERAEIPVTGNLDVGAIPLGAYDPPVLLSGSVRGRTPRGEKVPVAGATVLVAGEVGEGTWSEQVTTTAQGDFEVSVPPARYEIQIRPPLESEHATASSVIVLAAATSQEWVLERRARLWGQVRDPAGQAVSGIYVQAIRRSSLSTSQAEPLRDIRGVDTDAAGRYEMRLDAGLYDLSFIPQGKPFARVEVTNFAMSAGDMHHDIQLPAGAAVAGVVRDQAGRPFPEITVEVYENAGARPAAKLLGSGITDAEGRYRVVVPATPR